jgi:hypothetical protein
VSFLELEDTQFDEQDNIRQDIENTQQYKHPSKTGEVELCVVVVVIVCFAALGL